MRRPSASGFTLIEVLVMLAVLTVLAGVAVPFASRVVTKSKVQATEVEMKNLADGLLDYLEETGSWPAGLQILIDEGFLAGAHKPGDALVDAWAMSYAYTKGTDQATLVSTGSDRVVGGVDLTLLVDGRSVFRRGTRDEMETIHVALRSYEIARGKGEVPDLPDFWLSKKVTEKGALDLLIDEGLLPGGSKYERDAWGSPYEYAGSPSDAVVSPGLLQDEGGEGGGDDGWGDGD